MADRTTRCCRGGAARLIQLLAGAAIAAGAIARADLAAADEQPARLFPLGIVWSADLASAPVAWPVFDAERAYVPLRNGRLAAVTLQSGQTSWSVELSTTVSPAAGEGAVFVNTGDAIHALDATTGRPRWRLALNEASSAPLVWDTGWLIVGLDSGAILAVRGDNGQPLWRQVIGQAPKTPPAIGGDRLYVPTDRELVTLQLTTGAILWRRSFDGAVAEILPLGERLFVGSRDNYFYCLAGDNGRLLWRWRVGADVVGAPVVDDARVYFVAMDNLLRALDRRHGAQRWRKPLSLRPLAGPLIAGDLVLVAGLGTVITGYTAQRGTIAGRFTAPAEIVAPPHLVEGPTPTDHVLYLLTGEGSLYAIGHRVEPPLQPLDFIPGTPVVEPPVAAAAPKPTP